MILQQIVENICCLDAWTRCICVSYTSLGDLTLFKSIRSWYFANIRLVKLEKVKTFIWSCQVMTCGPMWSKNLNYSWKYLHHCPLEVLFPCLVTWGPTGPHANILIFGHHYMFFCVKTTNSNKKSSDKLVSTFYTIVS